MTLLAVLESLAQDKEAAQAREELRRLTQMKTRELINEENFEWEFVVHIKDETTRKRPKPAKVDAQIMSAESAHFAKKIKTPEKS